MVKLYLILALALGLRLINLNQSLWLDEAILARAVSRLSLTDLLTKFMPTDFNPPLYYLTEWVWGRLFGFSEIALRLPSVIFAVATVYLVYRLGGRLAALLLATSGLHIYYSQEARMYSLATLAVVASFYFLKQKRFGWYVVSMLAAVYTHYLTVLILPAQKKVPLWARLTIGLGFLPWLPIFLRQLQAGVQASTTTWSSLGALSLKAAALIPVKFLIGRVSFEPPLTYALIVVPGLLVWFWLMLAGWRKAKDFIIWLAVPLSLSLLLALKLPILTYFRFLFLLPAVYLWLALGLSRLPKPLRPALVVFLIGFNLLTAAVYLTNARFHREDWRGLSQSLGLMNPDQKPVYVIAAVEAPLAYYYAGQIKNYGWEQPGVGETEIWVVPYAQPIFDPQRAWEGKLALSGFQPVLTSHFVGNLTLIKYRRL